MATSFTGSLGQTNNYSSITELITQWPTAAQNQSIQLSGIAFDGGVTDYLDPTVISNLTLATNESPKSWLTYGAVAGIGVPSSYDGWFTYITKTRAEINYNPNTDESQVLKMKWADNQEITKATIGISALLPKSSSIEDDQGNEVGLLRLFKDGAPVSASNFTINRLNAPNAPKPITVFSNGVTFISDRIDGDFAFEIVGDSLTGATFDELQFSTKAYDSPTAAYLASPFKDDSSDYLVRNIEYQGIFNVTPTSPSLFEFQQQNYTVPEGGVATINVTRTGGTGAASINYATFDGSASSAGTAADYTSVTGLLNFAAGQTTASFTVPALTDSILESPETVNLVLFGGNVSNPSILTINDVSTGTTVTPTPTPTSPSLFQFQQPNYTVAEGGPATINVIRTGGTGAATISYGTVDGSASSPADYTGTAGTLNFAAGQTIASFTVPTLIDSILESPETVNLVLSGGNIGSNPSILTILDGPAGTTVTPTPTPTPTPGTTTSPTTVPTYFFGAANYNVNEGSTAGITINRSGNISQPSAILFSTGDGSASSPADYNGVTQGVFFAAGQTTAQVSVQTLFDPLTESAETVNLFLAGGSLASPSVAVLSIIDPSFVAPTFFSYGSSPGSIADGQSGTFTINRTGGNTSVSATVDYLIAPPNGSGQPFNFIDYTIMPFGNFTGGTVNFNPGQTSVSLMITNNPGLTGGNVGLGFAPNTNSGIPGSTTITLL